MSNAQIPKPGKPNSLQTMDAQLPKEIAINTCNARLLRLLADCLDNRSDAQVAAVMFELHDHDAKKAIGWLAGVQRDIFHTIKVMALCVALEGKERDITRGGK